MKARRYIEAGSFSKPITTKNQQNGGYAFMFCPNVTLDTYAVLSHILENLAQIHYHTQTNHSQQELSCI